MIASKISKFVVKISLIFFGSLIPCVHFNCPSEIYISKKKVRRNLSDPSLGVIKDLHEP